MSLHLRIDLDWRDGDASVDLGALADLLEVVAACGTVQAAADRLRLSYRSVWGKLDSAETLLGQQLMVKRKGHGSELSDTGLQLVAAVQALRGAVREQANGPLQAAQRTLDRLLGHSAAPLTLFCSHDIALADCVQAGLLEHWQIRTMGSYKAVEAMRAGSADLAGFHGAYPPRAGEAIADLAADPAFFVRPLMQRELGFVVARGNPLGIRGAADLARPEVRLINRQRQSGTRSWLDQLIGDAAIDPASIRGYRQEEFTHSAVVQAVAAGAADVAFAVRAATAGLAVDFLAVGLETYYLAGRAALAADARVTALGATLTARMAAHPGYQGVPE
jgi:putative molybdopterin biosynthesis protein